MAIVCVSKCFHRGRLWKKGDEYTPDEGEKVPHHFRDLSAGEPLPGDPTPRLGAKLKKRVEFASMKAPGKDAAVRAEE